MPPDPRQTREQILVVAERLFAEHGLDGVSLRSIAAEAGVQIALVQYHFGNKESLFRAIWTLRAAPEAQVRGQMLAAVDYTRPQAEVLRQLVDIFLQPTLLMMGDERGRQVMRIIGREVAHPKEQEHGVLKDYLDPMGRLMMGALARALPELTPAEVAWGFQHMTGIIIIHMVDVDRTTRVSDGVARSGDIAAARATMRDYIVGGWLALLQAARERAAAGAAARRPLARKRSPARKTAARRA